MNENAPQLSGENLSWLLTFVALGLGVAFLYPMIFPRESNKPTPLHTPIKPRGPSTSRDLDVVFQWNGHSFEAHEVLGIPKGAGSKRAREAYQKLARGQAEPFLAAALAAIEESAQKQG